MAAADPPFEDDASALLPRVVVDKVEQMAPEGLVSLLEGGKQIVVSLSDSPIDALARPRSTFR